MTDVFKTSLLAGAVALLAATPTFADTTARTPEQNKVLYELQEKCAKDAADFLDRVKAGKVYGALLKTGYNELQNIESQNHYSARFNRYFMWMADTVQAPVHDKTQISVWDVNANRKIAGFSAISDDIGAKAKICWVLKPDYLNRFEFGNNVEDRDLYATRGEQVGGRAFWPKWNALIKPYMQDSD